MPQIVVWFNPWLRKLSQLKHTTIPLQQKATFWIKMSRFEHSTITGYLFKILRWTRIMTNLGYLMKPWDYWMQLYDSVVMGTVYRCTQKYLINSSVVCLYSVYFWKFSRHYFELTPWFLFTIRGEAPTLNFKWYTVPKFVSLCCCVNRRVDIQTCKHRDTHSFYKNLFL